METLFTNKGKSSFLVTLLFLTFINIIDAQTTYTWIGSVDTNFYNVNNWSDSSIDFSNAQNTTLIIGPGSPHNPTQNGGNSSDLNYRPNYLNVYTGGNLTFNGTLLPWNSSYLNGVMTLNDPAYLNIRNDIYLGRTTDGTININGGSLNNKNLFYIGYDNGGNGILNVLGGTVYVGSYLEIATSPSGTSPTGVLNISGGVVEVPNSVNIGANGSIYISDLGSLTVNGDQRTTLDAYISSGKISSPAGTTLASTFDGSRTTVALTKDPNRLIKEYASYIILDNGILQARIDKATSNIESLIVNGVETLQQNGGSRSGTYYDFTGSYGFDKISGTIFSIKEETADFIDVSFKRTYSNGSYLAPCDADIHYVLKKNDTGLYTYSILNHKAEYPEFDLGSWRQVIWIADDGTDYLTENIYVNDIKNWQMPSAYDNRNADPTPIQEIIKLTTGVRAGKYDGKYEYSENLLDLPVWGHASDVNHIGSWAVFGSHEFFPEGPTSHDLNAAAGIIHVLLTNVHYNSRGFNIPQGEDWSKIYGPYLIYTSEAATGTANWEDAKARAAQERAEWPYAWLTNTPEYPLAAERGNIVGNFSITDSEKPDLDGGNAWIGVTQLSNESNGDWQFESKNFQYWVKTDASGNFDIKNVRPGTYTLFAIKKGAVNEYRMENVVVSASNTNNLGSLNWTIPRNNGNLVWEIGIPDRTAAEFKFGYFDYCEGFVQNKFGSTFPNPIDYNIADKNWSDVLPYVHSTYFNSDGSFQTWDWNLHFDLSGTIPTTGNAKLNIAFASADHAQYWVYVNGARITPIPNYPPVSGGNAFLRQSNHAKYGLTVLDIPYNLLHTGENIIKLQMPSTSNPSVNHVMYDYISLEGNLTRTLSMNDFEKKKPEIKIFPNPTSDVINVKLQNIDSNNMTLFIYNLLGKQIIKTTLTKSISNAYAIDINNKFVSGIYIIKIVTENGNYNSKFIVK